MLNNWNYKCNWIWNIEKWLVRKLRQCTISPWRWKNFGKTQNVKFILHVCELIVNCIELLMKSEGRKMTYLVYTKWINTLIFRNVIILTDWEVKSRLNSLSIKSLLDINFRNVKFRYFFITLEKYYASLVFFLLIAHTYLGFKMTLHPKY